MGSYSKATLIALERELLDAHERKAKQHCPPNELPSPSGLAKELGLPEAYIRRYAFERRLNPFGGKQRLNDIWMAGYLVIYLGHTVTYAAKATGFTQAGVEHYLARNNWGRFTLWGKRGRSKGLLVIPEAFREAGWRVYKTRGDFSKEMLAKHPTKPGFFKQQHQGLKRPLPPAVHAPFSTITSAKAFLMDHMEKPVTT